MIPWLWQSFLGAETVPGLSARSMGATITAFALGILLTPRFLRIVRKLEMVDNPKQHGGLNVLTKSGVPSMGGIIIITSTFVAAMLWCRIAVYVPAALSVGIYFAVVGAMDDIGKARGKASNAGLSRGAKYITQIGMGLLLGLLMFIPGLCPIRETTVARSLYLPFTSEGFYLGFGIVPAVVLFIVFASNSVNLTDGMDGLAIVPVIFVAGVMGLFAYLSSNVKYADYLQLNAYRGSEGELLHHTLRGAGELTVLCGAIIGSGTAFLWHNAHPASVFMGDTGSLALGGMLGAIAVMIRQEAVFLIAGGLLVAELGSSFIQEYIGLRLLGRRILPRAPLHLTLLHRGVGETKVTIRLWIVAALCALVALATLRLK